MSSKLHLFQAYGIECEYMIVQADTLRAMPVSDKLLQELSKEERCSDVVRGEVGWSNELVKHVMEIKCNGPLHDLKHIRHVFSQDIAEINTILKEKFSARLMPTAMHPLFNPQFETNLWPYDEEKIYHTYNKIFNCKGHGWSNLQSVHINLPFDGDHEFARLHAAVRLVLPIIPALAASSPIVEGKITGLHDNRLQYYMMNQKKIASVSGHIIPEQIFSIDEYDRLLQRIYSDIQPYDHDGILQHEWLNSRGAIARFERNAIEIRLMDIQESPRADFAIIAAVVSMIRALVDETWVDFGYQKTLKAEDLKKIFLACLSKGEHAHITDHNYLKVFGKTEELSALNLWKACSEELLQKNDYPLLHFYEDLKVILNQGTLSTRILKALQGESKTPEHIISVYSKLCDCLSSGSFFHG